MKKLFLSLLVLGVGSVFAASAATQAAEQQAMTDCLKTKTHSNTFITICLTAQNYAKF